MNKTYLLPFNFISIVIMISMATGVLFGQIFNSYYILAIALILLLISSFLQKFTSKDYKKASLIILVLFLITQINISPYFTFSEWDDYSNWLPAIFWIFENNKIYSHDAFVTIKSYPPGTQIFQNFILQFTGWSERNIVIANNLLSLSILLSAFSFIKHEIKSINQSFLIMLLALFFIYLFGFNFRDIYVDKIVSLLFLNILMIIFITFKNNKVNSINLFNLFLSSSLMIIIKDVGIVFAGYALLICLILFYQTKNKDFYKTLAVIIISFFWYMLWQYHLANIGSHFTRVDTLSSLIDIFNNKERFLLTIQNFFKLLILKSPFKGSLFVKFIPFSIVAIIFYNLVIAKFSSEKEKFFLKLIFWLGISFAFFLLFLYLTVFGEYEGVRLASFYRYFNTFWLAIFIFTLFVNSMRVNQLVINNKKVLLLFLFLIFMNYKFFTEFIFYSPSKEFVENKNLIYDFSEFIKKEIPDNNKKIYFIDPNTRGFENVLFTYLMLPYQTSRWCWSFGKPYYENDVWTCEKKLIDERFPKFDYLAIFNTDKNFEESLLNSNYKYSDKIERGIYNIQNGQITLIKKYVGD